MINHVAASSSSDLFVSTHARRRCRGVHLDLSATGVVRRRRCRRHHASSGTVLVPNSIRNAVIGMVVVSPGRVGSQRWHPDTTTTTVVVAQGVDGGPQTTSVGPSATTTASKRHARTDRYGSLVTRDASCRYTHRAVGVVDGGGTRRRTMNDDGRAHLTFSVRKTRTQPRREETIARGSMFREIYTHSEQQDHSCVLGYLCVLVPPPED